MEGKMKNFSTLLYELFVVSEFDNAHSQTVPKISENCTN